MPRMFSTNQEYEILDFIDSIIVSNNPEETGDTWDNDIVDGLINLIDDKRRN